MHAEDESLLAAFEQMLDLPLHVVDRADMRHAAAPSIRREDENPLGFAEHGDVGVVRHEDELPPPFYLAETLDDRIVDEGIVEIVLRLIDQQRSFALEPQDRKNDGAALAGR